MTHLEKKTGADMLSVDDFVYGGKKFNIMDTIL